MEVPLCFEVHWIMHMSHKLCWLTLNSANNYSLRSQENNR